MFHSFLTPQFTPYFFSRSKPHSSHDQYWPILADVGFVKVTPDFKRLRGIWQQDKAKPAKQPSLGVHKMTIRAFLLRTQTGRKQGDKTAKNRHKSARVRASHRLGRGHNHVTEAQPLPQYLPLCCNPSPPRISPTWPVTSLPRILCCIGCLSRNPNLGSSKPNLPKL